MSISRTQELDQLEDRAKRDIDDLSYPKRDWVKSPADQARTRTYDVVIVGGGQSGLSIAQSLRREGVQNILVLDKNPPDQEGVWSTIARMDELRTPKYLSGLEGGIPSLSIMQWYRAVYGEDKWDEIDRVPRKDWAEYLRWFRRVCDLPIENSSTVIKVKRDDPYIRLSVLKNGEIQSVTTRLVVLATGYDGGGEWTIPPHITQTVPPGLLRHSNSVIDFDRYHGRRVGILGCGASAFDNAVAVLNGGAEHVDLCFRRPKLPSVSPHIYVEFAGFLKHYPELPDSIKWDVALHFEAIDQPPASRSYLRAHEYGNFRLHSGFAWDEVNFIDGKVHIKSAGRELIFDEIICATGMAVDISKRPEISHLDSTILKWEDVLAAAQASSKELSKHPYLDAHYALQSKDAANADFLSRVFMFNFAARVSMGPHSTSVSGYKFSVPRVVHGITKRLMLDQAEVMLEELRSYDANDLPAIGQSRNQS